MKKYTGEISKELLMFMEKYGYDESDILENEAGNLFVMHDEDEGTRHPDDPIRPASYPQLVDLSEFYQVSGHFI